MSGWGRQALRAVLSLSGGPTTTTRARCPGASVFRVPPHRSQCLSRAAAHPRAGAPGPASPAAAARPRAGVPGPASPAAADHLPLWPPFALLCPWDESGVPGAPTASPSTTPGCPHGHGALQGPSASGGWLQRWLQRAAGLRSAATPPCRPWGCLCPSCGSVTPSLWAGSSGQGC